MNYRLRASILFIAAGFASADEVVMKNGDRLTGDVVKLDGGKLVFKSQFAGEATIPWDAVLSLKSDKLVYVGLKNGQTVAGKIAAEPSVINIESGQGTADEPRAEVQAIRSPAEQRTYLRNLYPTLFQLWTGGVDFGLAATTGNSDTTTYNLGANVTRQTTHDRLTAVFTSLYSTNNGERPHLVTANERRGDLNYSYNLTKRLFTFGEVDLEYDELQGLNLRVSPNGGVGDHVFRTDRSYLDLFAGLSFDREYFTTATRSSAEALLGNEYNRKIGKMTQIREKFIIYPNLTAQGQYRANLDVTGSTAFRKWVSFQVTLSDRYLSDPLAAFKKNDIIYSTGLHFVISTK